MRARRSRGPCNNQGGKHILALKLPALWVVPFLDILSRNLARG
jgi:hypothetical protein